MQSYAFSGEIFDWMAETGRWPPEHLLRFVSYPFIHASLTHGAFAGVILLAMGKMVAEAFGQWRMLVIFVISGIGGALVYADALRIASPITDRLSQKAALNGRRAMASLLYVAPDAEDRLQCLRAILSETPDEIEAAASAFDGLLTARLTAPGGGALMRALAEALEKFRGAPVPRGWRC